MVFTGGILITCAAWQTGRTVYHEARLASFQRDSDTAILQTRQFVSRNIDTLKAFQAFSLSSSRETDFDFSNFVTRIIDDSSPIMLIAGIDLTKPADSNIELLFDRNYYRLIYDNRDHILGDCRLQKSADVFFIGIFDNKSNDRKILTLGIPTDNMNPYISHDRFTIMMVDITTLVRSINVRDVDSFMDVSVSSDISPSQSLFHGDHDDYKAHDEDTFERSETIPDMGGTWSFHFDRPIEEYTLGIPDTAFVLLIGILMTSLATAGLHLILRSLESAERERDERRVVDEKRRLLEAVVTSASDGVVITKADQISYPGPEIIYVNAAQIALSGYSADELLGKSPRLFQSSLTEKEQLSEIKHCLSTGTPWRGELMNRARDGSDYWVDLSIVPVRNPDGKVTHFASLQRDITEKRAQQTALYEATRQAEASARLKSEFLATMSHEIRTPLNGIIGMTSLLLDSPLAYEQRHQAETVLDSAETLLHLLNDILDFSKIEAGKLDVEDIAFDVHQVVGQLVDMMAQQARRKGLELLLRIDPGVARYITGDPARLRQVLFNLVGNAVKFTESGFVRIEVTEFPDFGLPPDMCRLRFSVTDTGIGISDDKLNMIFDKFSQADSSTTRQFGGSGLGLAICQQLCRLMGGDIGVESKAGVGSTFWFTLTAGKADSARVTDRPNHDYNPDAHQNEFEHGQFDGIRVLMAEDNPVNGLVFTQALERLGCIVTHVTDGQQAVETIPTGRFDLVLLDCQMPVMDGYTAAGILRHEMNEGILRTIPIIALTASAMKGDREKCLTAGMDDYLTKPLNFGALVATMRTWLGSSYNNQTFDTADIAAQIAQFPDGIDWNAFDECADIMGDAMTDMVCRFLDSVEGYITRIAEGYDQTNIQIINKAAHPLKSSAAQIGAILVSEQARGIEMLTLPDQPSSWSDIQPELDQYIATLEQAFLKTAPKLKERCGTISVPNDRIVM